MNVAVSQISSAIESAFPFSVDKFRLTGPEGMRTNHFGLFRSDTLECVGNACREGYQPHTTEDIVALAEAGAGAFGGECNVRCTWRHGHVVSIAPTDDFRQSIYNGKDNIFPRLIITARYDGTAFKGTLALFRDLCDNLQMLHQEGVILSASIKHTTSLATRVDSLRDQFSTVAANWNQVGDLARQMEATQVKLTDFVREVYPQIESDSTRARNSAEKRIGQIFTRIARERLESGRPAIGSDFMVSAWEAFNGVQGYAQHDKKRQGNPDRFNRALIAMGDSAVQRAEALAVSTALSA